MKEPCLPNIFPLYQHISPSINIFPLPLYFFSASPSPPLNFSPFQPPFCVRALPKVSKVPKVFKVPKALRSLRSLRSQRSLKSLRSLRLWGWEGSVASFFFPDSRHALRESAVVCKIIRQPRELSEKQIISLIDKYDCHIGDCLRWTRFD